MATVSCPSCGRALEVDDTYRDWTVRCPHCSAEFGPAEVPQPEAPARRRRDEDHEDDRPRRRDEEYEDDYDRPSRRRRDDYEDDYEDEAHTRHTAMTIVSGP